MAFHKLKILKTPNPNVLKKRCKKYIKKKRNNSIVSNTYTNTKKKLKNLNATIRWKMFLSCKHTKLILGLQILQETNFTLENGDIFSGRSGKIGAYSE
jgi:hypothetical protein